MSVTQYNFLPSDLTKYYVAYRLTLDAQAEAAKARQQVVPVKS